MADEADRVAVLDQRVVARDLLIDRDEYLLLTNQLQQVAKLHTLSLDDLADK